MFRTTEHAVARDVGMDHRFDALPRHACGKVNGAHRRGLDPPAHGDAPIAGIDADRHAVAAERLHDGINQRRLVDRRGADHHARHAKLNDRLRSCHVADAPAELHLQPITKAARDLGDRRVVVAVAEGPIEVDHVQPAGPASTNCSAWATGSS